MIEAYKCQLFAGWLEKNINNLPRKFLHEYKNNVQR